MSVERGTMVDDRCLSIPETLMTVDSQTPHFENPPVVEVAISLQFKPLATMKAPHFGAIWQQYKAIGFSIIEEHAEVERSFEEFQKKPIRKFGINFQMFEAPPPARVWFLNEGRTELIQVQRDRLTVNWRKGAEDNVYPRYTFILDRFKRALDLLKRAVDAENLGEVVPTQCELTYVNHIPAGGASSGHANLEKYVTLFRVEYSDDFLRAPENTSLAMRYLIPGDLMPLGRLHIDIDPAFQEPNDQPIYVMSLTGRGKASSIAEAMEMFDLEHEWIVRGFASITTREMHKIWRRTK